MSIFCSQSKDIISQIENDVNNTEFVTIELLSEIEVQSEVNGIIEYQKSNAFDQMTSFMNYFKTTIQANILVSALGTNWVVLIGSEEEGVYNPITYLIWYWPNFEDASWCGQKNFITPATLNGSFDITDSDARLMITGVIGTIVNGFYSGCTPLEGLLESTLDCLYKIECLRLLLDYFPKLNEVCIV